MTSPRTGASIDPALQRLHAELRAAATTEEPIQPFTLPETNDIVADIARDAERLRANLMRALADVRAERQALRQQAPLIDAWSQVMQSAAQVNRTGLSITGFTRAAEGLVAGDWWDVVPRPDGGTGIVIADVCGHGTFAAITSITARTVLRSCLLSGFAPDLALRMTATSVDALHPMTAIVVEIDATGRVLRYANAGHPPGLILDREGNDQWLTRTGLIVSPLADEWETRVVDLEPGDLLVLTTDGLLETPVGDGRLFDSTGLLEAARALGASDRIDSRLVLSEILATARSRATHWAADDVTVLVSACID